MTRSEHALHALALVAALATSLPLGARPLERPSHPQTTAPDPRTAVKEELYREFYARPPRTGEKAPSFSLPTTAGATLVLSELVAEGPVVLDFGNSTCPPFQKRSASMKALEEKWKGRVGFAVVYVRESNPDRGPFVGIRQPKTQAERDALATRFAAQCGRVAPIAVDRIDDAVLRAYGEPFNATYVVGRDGTVLYKEPWAPPARIDEELARIFGETRARARAARAGPADASTALELGGMSCQGCAIAVRNALLNVDGVESADVDLVAGTARVKHGSGVKPGDLVDAVLDTGFGAKAR